MDCSLTQWYYSFLYTHFVSLDACFCIKRYDISDETKDPIIDDGLAYFVSEGPYKEKIKKYKGQTPVSRRLDFQACSLIWRLL